MTNWSKGAARLSNIGLALLVGTAFAACGGGGESSSTPATSTPAAGSTATAAPAAPAATGDMTAPAPGAPPAGATAAMVALGDSIFHGTAAGGLCFTCHGVDAKGTVLAPNLTDTEWATGDGTYDFIQKRVTDGMPQPTPPYTAPMLPMGGAQLTPDQIKAVAAYVYSISHQ